MSHMQIETREVTGFTIKRTCLMQSAVVLCPDKDQCIGKAFLPHFKPLLAGIYLRTFQWLYLCCVLLWCTDITEALGNQVDEHWNRFGNSRRFHSTLMDTINTNNRDCADCMLNLVTKWVSRDDDTGDLPRTWETVVKVVKASGHKQLAEELARKFE